MKKPINRDLILGVGLFVVMAATVFIVVNWESGPGAAPTAVQTMEAPAVNPGEKATTQEEEPAPARPAGDAISQEALLREEVLRANREMAIRNLKDNSK